MNKVEMIGRITKDIEVHYSQSNTAVTTFSLAVSRRKSEGGADFPACIAFGKTAELLAKYTRKGSKIGVCGQIQTGSYEKDGRTVYTTQVVVNEIEFLEASKKAEGGDQAEEAPAPAQGEFVEIPVDDELPF